MPPLRLTDYIASFADSPLVAHAQRAPWTLTTQSEAIVRGLLGTLPRDGYRIEGDIAVHASATIEPGAVIKGPLVLGPGCFVAAGAYLRGGNWLQADCTIGPGAELKSSFVFRGTKLAHFNFVGDSVLGAGVNLEAGSIVANYRNERADPHIHVRLGNALQPTGVHKFGALIGDRGRLGANAVAAPGTLLLPGTVVGRLQLVDQERSAT